ncbi:glutathione S-transferase family protein [Acidisphaera sp. S103]|uniref:glutathione S-transferase family protein n=1 Tax=Acidisphaera sp. S103 TaxID=1747223 RepID=UPI00131EA3D6|nr:glutathione S-transferase family protein [Acidisphaera sp. S103]
MTLIIYGSPRSRTLRVLWAAAELGIDYEHVPLAADDPALRQTAFLQINPAGTIPAIVDDGFALSESLAINLYLAKKYGGTAALYPSDARGEAEVWRWTLWAQAHLEPWVQQDARLAALRSMIEEQAREAVDLALGLLDRTLAERHWLVGTHFTVSDLNVATVLSPSRVRLLDMTPYPNVDAWLRRCYGRPAAVATRERFG